jgi:hypothetical protein
MHPCRKQLPLSTTEKLNNPKTIIMKLQEKASSAKTHFIISFIKSIIRLIGCGALYYGHIPLAALLIGGAELLGIAEEIF